jgi:hypothetical protein
VESQKRNVLLGLILLGFTGGLIGLQCSTLEKEADLLSKLGTFCSNVNNQNWYTASWSPMSAQKMCETKAKREMRNFVLETNLRPCSFGGIPMFCRTLENGNVILYQTDREPLEITAADLERIRPHLTVH